MRQFKIKIMFNFVIFVATKKGRTTIFFSPLSFVAVFGSGVWDGQKSGSGINNPDPQHWQMNIRVTYTICVVCSNLTGQLSRIQGDLDRSTRTEREAVQQVSQLFTTTLHHVQYSTSKLQSSTVTHNFDKGSPKM